MIHATVDYVFLYACASYVLRIGAGWLSLVHIPLTP